MADSRIRAIRKGEEQALASSISKAFFDDPMMHYIMPNASKRIKRSEWMFGNLIGYVQNFGHVYTDDNQTGGSIWLPPGKTTIGAMDMMRAGMWQMPFRVGLRGFLRFGRLDGAASKAHKKAVPGDHWYLLGLGVDPDAQKTGLGTEAIEIGADQAQADGLPVYLETMTQANVDYYSKRGFEVAEELTVDDELRIWAMVKQPS